MSRELDLIFKHCQKSHFNVNLISLLWAPLNSNIFQYKCFRTINFAKKLCRSSFRKHFSLKQCAAHLNTAVIQEKESRNQYINVNWVAEQLIQNIEQKQNIKLVIEELIQDAKSLFRLWHNVEVLKGLKIVVKGRLTRKKDALAQWAYFIAGKVPLNTLGAKIDYTQWLIPTRFGSVGLKVWLCFK